MNIIGITANKNISKKNTGYADFFIAETTQRLIERQRLHRRSGH